MRRVTYRSLLFSCGGVNSCRDSSLSSRRVLRIQSDTARDVESHTTIDVRVVIGLSLTIAVELKDNILMILMGVVREHSTDEYVCVEICTSYALLLCVCECYL